MQDESLNRPNFNAQTQRLRHTVQQGTSLTTRRAERLGQIFLCEPGLFALQPESWLN